MPDAREANGALLGPEPAAPIVCAECGAPMREGRFRCSVCGGLPEVVPPSLTLGGAALAARFRQRKCEHGVLATSGVWRFRELVAPRIPIASIVSLGEGNTALYESPSLGRWAGFTGPLWLKHEGQNPTGSFKDRGMSVGVSRARELGARALACASTGNTSSSLAAYAARADMRAFVFVPAGKISPAKLAQTIAHGARVLEIEGNFDAALRVVEHVASTLPIYLLNSVNPWRIEGQKAIVFELLEQFDWQAPDVLALPAGNLGNTSAFGKALIEAKRAGLIGRLPKLVPVQAEGASPFDRFMRERLERLVPEPEPETVASAIRIGNPRSWQKAKRALERTGGLSVAVSDEEILDAKARIDAEGIGCEPASAASLAGLRKLVAAGEISRRARCCCVLTGHLLKDADTTARYHTGALAGRYAHPPVRLPAEPEAIVVRLAAEIEESGSVS